jgi:hypothetical protein
LTPLFNKVGRSDFTIQPLSSTSSSAFEKGDTNFVHAEIFLWYFIGAAVKTDYFLD